MQRVPSEEKEIWTHAMRSHLERYGGHTVPGRWLTAAIAERDVTLSLPVSRALELVERIFREVTFKFGVPLFSGAVAGEVTLPDGPGRRVWGTLGWRGVVVVVTVELTLAPDGETQAWIRAAARFPYFGERAARSVADKVAESLSSRAAAATAPPQGHWFTAGPDRSPADQDELEPMSDAELALSAALRERTAELAPPGFEGYVDMGGADGVTEPLVAAIELYDRGDGPPWPQRLLLAGIRLLGDRVRGDLMRDTAAFALPEQPSSWALDAVGPPGEIADAAARWLHMVAEKPIVQYVWLHEGRAYAAAFAFADTAEILLQAYDGSLAPPGQGARLAAAGHVDAEGRILAVGLPAPDRYWHLRGDLGAARLPPGVPQAAKRQLMDTAWY